MSANIAPGAMSQQYLRPSSDSTDGQTLNIEALVAHMRANIEVKDRKYHLTTYKSVFLGSDGVNWMLQVRYEDISAVLLKLHSMLLLVVARGKVAYSTQMREKVSSQNDAVRDNCIYIGC
jgi:hypothetical protein